MFSMTGSLSDDDYDGSHPPATGLSSMFLDAGEEKETLSYRAPKQPVVQHFQNKEEKEEKNHELVGFEPMSNIKPGVKMATAVNAYKFENNGFKSMGKLGLAIIGNRESNFFQLLLYRGKQIPVAVANITPDLQLFVQPNNHANFTDDKKNSWTVGFESQDLLINFAKQVLLCKTVFRCTETLSCDLKVGEGRELGVGDTVEISLTGWSIEHQSIGPMQENVAGKKWKIGAKGSTGWETGLIGMKKGGRRFLVCRKEQDEHPMAYDVQITRAKTKDVSMSGSSSNQETLKKIRQVGQNVLIQREPEDNPSPEIPELELIEDELQRGLPKRVSSTSSLYEAADQQRLGRAEAKEVQHRRTSLHSTQGSVYSAGCSAAGQPYQHRQESAYEIVGRQEMNMLLSETRLSNTELRMNMTRMSDKIDELLKRTGANVNVNEVPSVNLTSTEPNNFIGKFSESFSQLRRELDVIKSQTNEISSRVKSIQGGSSSGSSIQGGSSKDVVQLQTEKLREMKEVLEEKEIQLKNLLTVKKEDLERLDEHNSLLARLEDCETKLQNYRNKSGEEICTEMKKILSSTAKFLVSQFDKEQTYSGEDIQYTVAETLQRITEKVEQKYLVQTVQQPPQEEPQYTQPTVRDVPINIVRSHPNQELTTRSTSSL